MKIHLYTLCYNEEHILPFVLEHYAKLCDKIVVYDNNSTDRSLEIMKACPLVEVRPLGAVGFDDVRNIEIKNNCWKESRGIADWVIVADMDELLYVDKSYLQRMTDAGVTIVKPHGYNMISETYPVEGMPITKQITRGMYDPQYSKAILFNPDALREIGYEPGAHICHPTGLVAWNEPDDNIKLLHYHHLTLAKVLNKHAETFHRINKDNLAHGMGVQCAWSTEEHTKNFYGLLRDAKEVI